MLVRATRPGYYGDKLRREGEVFELVTMENGAEPVSAEKQFSKNWMEELDPETQKPKIARKPAVKVPGIPVAPPKGVPVTTGKPAGSAAPGMPAARPAAPAPAKPAVAPAPAKPATSDQTVI